MSDLLKPLVGRKGDNFTGRLARETLLPSGILTGGERHKKQRDIFSARFACGKRDVAIVFGVKRVGREGPRIGSLEVELVGITFEANVDRHGTNTVCAVLDVLAIGGHTQSRTRGHQTLKRVEDTCIRNDQRCVQRLFTARSLAHFHANGSRT